MHALRILAGFLAASASVNAQGWTTFVGDAGPDYVLLAWGKPGPGNVIGRGAASPGKARVTVGSRSVETDRAWAVVDGLQPDTPFAYTVQVNGQTVGQGNVRTWPRAAQTLTFIVLGDYGNGSREQRLLGDAMAKTAGERAAAGRPVRFALTTGDNIYGSLPFRSGSGQHDTDWWPRYFEPFAALLRQVPVYPSLGNHDGNESEKRGDLLVYLDNFFFPGGKPARWYRFSFGGLADFFALDSTQNSETGPTAPVYLPDGEQTAWLRKELAASKALWKIPYFHHPAFNAGPFHESPKADQRIRHWVNDFAQAGVKVAFQGHEHNYQVSTADAATSGIRFFITGAGGQLRSGNVRSNMASAHIEAWARQRHFLIVDIDGRTMTVEPRSYEPVTPVDRNGAPLPPAIRITLP